MIPLWVGLGAAIGAPLRYYAALTLRRKLIARLPLGTLVVNLVAAFVLGVLAGVSHLDATVAALVGTGFCGALSTWSTLALEIVELSARRRQRAMALLYLVFTVVAGTALAAAGWSLAG